MLTVVFVKTGSLGCVLVLDDISGQTMNGTNDIMEEECDENEFKDAQDEEDGVAESKGVEDEAENNHWARMLVEAEQEEAAAKEEINRLEKLLEEKQAEAAKQEEEDNRDVHRMEVRRAFLAGQFHILRQLRDQHLECPLSLDVFNEPVLMSDGMTYEKDYAAQLQTELIVVNGDTNEEIPIGAPRNTDNIHLVEVIKSPLQRRPLDIILNLVTEPDRKSVV